MKQEFGESDRCCPELKREQIRERKKEPKRIVGGV